MSEAKVSAQSWQSWWAISSLLVIVSSFLYLLGYWSTFDVNVLEFLGVGDILRVAAFPLATSVAAMLLGIILSEIINLPASESRRHFSETKLGAFCAAYALYLRLLVALVLAAALFFGDAATWVLIGMLAAIPVSLLVRSSGLSPSTGVVNLDRALVFGLTVMVLTAVGLGKRQAEFIVNGTSFRYLTLNEIGPPYSADPESATRQARYVGAAGEMVFFFRPDNSAVIIVAASKVQRFELQQGPK